jgi:hypothetical protein
VSRSVGVWQLCATLALTPLVPAPAHAEQPPATDEQRSPTVVFVRMNARSGGDANLDVADLEAQLGEASARIVTAPGLDHLTLQSQALRAKQLAREHDALGTIWLSEEPGRGLRVYVYDAHHRQLASRTLSGPARAVREEVAVVLRSAISALIAGETTALEPVTMPPPSISPSPPPAALPRPAQPQRWLRLAVGAGYTGTTYASRTFQHGFELRSGAELGSRVLIGLSAAWSEDPRLSGGGAEAVLHRNPLELSAGYAFAAVPGFRCFAQAGLVLERVARRTRIEDARLAALPDENRYRFAVAPALLAAFDAQPGLLGFAAFGAEVATDQYDYVVQSVGGPIRLAPRTVRPRLEVGILVRLR